jgi:hypothetical protein
VANCETADRSIGSASTRTAAPGSLAGLPHTISIGSSSGSRELVSLLSFMFVCAQHAQTH